MITEHNIMMIFNIFRHINSIETYEFSLNDIGCGFFDWFWFGFDRYNRHWSWSWSICGNRLLWLLLLMLQWLLWLLLRRLLMLLWHNSGRHRNWCIRSVRLMWQLLLKLPVLRLAQLIRLRNGLSQMYRRWILARNDLAILIALQYHLRLSAVLRLLLLLWRWLLEWRLLRQSILLLTRNSIVSYWLWP